jgi:fibronectin-binding autotransporter adhesin
MKPRLPSVHSAFLKAAPALIVVVLSSSVAQAANKYWDTTGVAGLAAGNGTWDVGTTALWSTATAGTALTTFAIGDDAFFQTAGVNTVTLDADLTANSMTQTTNVTATTINPGVGTQITLTTGNLTNSGNAAFVINPNIALGASGTISTTNTITLGGILSGGFGFSKIGTSTLVLSAANTYSGTTNLLAGTTSIAGATASINFSSAINLGGTGIAASLSLDNAAGISDRVQDTAPISLSAGGLFSLVGNGTAGSVTETIGAVAIGSGASTISITGTGTGQLQTIAASGLSRSSLGTALVRGSSLGQQATNATRITLADTSGLNFVGTTTANNVTPGTAKNVRIVPWLIGDASGTGAGSNFVTYDTTAGLRPLASGETTTLTAGYTNSGENVRGFNGTLTTASPNFNSLVFSGTQALDGTGTLTVASGAVALVTNQAASISSNFSGLALGNGEGILSVTGSQTLTINTPISVTSGGGLIKAGGGSGALVLAAANLYTGPTTVNQGTLAIGSGGSTQASSAVTVISGGVLNVNSGGTVNGSVSAQVSTGQNTANVINSGTIGGAVSINAGTGPASPNANATAIVPTGHAQLNAGSSTGDITNNGQLTLSGSSSITAIGSISGAGSLGGLNDANTATKTLNLSAGSAFSYFRPTNATGTATSILQVAGAGATSFQWFGYNNAVGGTADVNFNGGTFNIGKIGQNNSGATTIGNFTVTNGSVLNIAAGGFEHGTWNIINGTMAFTGSIGQSNGTAVAASALQLTVNNSGGGSGSALSATGSLTLGHAGGASSVQNNFLTIGNGGTASFTSGLLSVGSTQAATSETNTVNLNGGKLLVGGTTGIVAGTGAGQTKTFNWTGGRLSALQITPGVNFTNPAGGGITTTGVVNSGGVLAPGDVGTAGRTIISGDYTQQAGGTLAIDIGGTNQTGNFQNLAGAYDNVLLNGGTTANLSLNGNLQVSLVGFTPTNGNTFTIIRSAPTALAVSGAFSNVAFGARVTTQGGEGSFLVSTSGNSVTLSDYQANTANDFVAWITPFSVSDPSFGGDPDSDGLDNGVENILGSNPSVYANGLTQISATSSSFKFLHEQSNSIASDVTKSYQWSTDLVNWAASGASLEGTTATIAENTITNVAAPGNDVIEVTVTVTGGSATKVFGRLVATKAP